MTALTVEGFAKMGTISELEGVIREAQDAIIRGDFTTARESVRLYHTRKGEIAELTIKRMLDSKIESLESEISTTTGLPGNNYALVEHKYME
jgi:hypothetical protein